MNFAETTRVALAASREDGRDFEAAWYVAIRAISPPRTAPKALHEDAAENRLILRETKPWWRAAYCGGEVADWEVELAHAVADKRLADINVAHDEPPV